MTPPAIIQDCRGCVRSINLILANQEVSQRDKRDTDNHADGYIPGNAPEITTLQHHQRLFRESREGCKTAAETHGQEQGPVAALGTGFQQFQRYHSICQSPSGSAYRSSARS